MALELVEQLASDNPRVERWLARDGHLVRIALFVDDEPFIALAIHEGFDLWLGFHHYALAAHLASGRIATRFERSRWRLVHEDDRGPTFAEAAQQIESPLDRECWAATELANMCDAITAMSTRFPNCVHRHAHDGRTFVAPDGYARLRPILGPGMFAPLDTSDRSRAPIWLSPEQVAGRPLEPTSDVFQLASTLYAALDGTHPFERGETPIDRLRSILDAPTPPPPRTTSSGLAQIFQIALAKAPADRFPTPAALAVALRRCVRSPPDSVYAEVAASRARSHAHGITRIDN